MNHHIVVLGGGFGGVYAALELERALAGRPEVSITLVNRENFLLFTPMLHEVAASDVDVTHIVNPIRKLLRRTRFVHGTVEAIDLERRSVSIAHGDHGHRHALDYDHLVLALGATTRLAMVPGLETHGLTMKSLGDAVALRNRLIASLEEADFECMSGEREALLTVVVAGGGFAGVETVAAINDFLREALRFYPRLDERRLRVVLVHSGAFVLPELGEPLGRYAQAQLAGRGVEIVLEARVERVEADAVTLSDGSVLPARTLVWTAGTAPHPLIAGLGLPSDRGRVTTDDGLAVLGVPGLWAIGDCAAIPDGLGGTHPPTAQHAIREARTLARNLRATLDGRARRPFRFRTLGQLAAIGRRTGVARIAGHNFSGFVAWWLWRTIYLSKLPRAEKKLRVMLDWTLDLVFSKDLVQIPTARSRGAEMVELPATETSSPTAA